MFIALAKTFWKVIKYLFSWTHHWNPMDLILNLGVGNINLWILLIKFSDTKSLVLENNVLNIRRETNTFVRFCFKQFRPWSDHPRSRNLVGEKFPPSTPMTFEHATLQWISSGVFVNTNSATVAGENVFSNF